MRRSRSDRRPLGPRALLTLLLSVSPAARLSGQATTDVGQVLNSGALFLLFPLGAQVVGMGQTAGALDGRGEAAFVDPAGLATLPMGEFALHSASLAAGTTSALRVFFPSRRSGVLG